MKSKLFFIIFIVVFLTSIAYSDEASEIFITSEVEARVDISSSAKIIFSAPDAIISNFQADILFFPKNDEYLTINKFYTKPKASTLGDKLRYTWSHPEKKLTYSYSADVKSKKQMPKIYSKIKYPISISKEIQKYLEPTKIIDSADREIKNLALSLTEGKDDLFEIVTTLAIWVKSNIKYDLSTLTDKASQSASWVLNHKIGVCDEITNLFLALLRSRKIPARFISGVSYTNSPQFPKKWGPHGWAEVYFPGIGWVPYDVTFGEYGWVDAGHIKMMESTDSLNPSTKFEWTGRDVDVEIEDLKINAKTLNLGPKTLDDIKINIELEKNIIGAGSYNLVKTTVENLRDYYVATELSLAKVTELEEITTKEKKQVILSPKEKRTVHWIVKVKDDLDPNYIYTIPILVYTIKNETDKKSFTVSKQSPAFSRNEIEQLTKGIEKPEIKDVDLSCSLQKDVFAVREEINMQCELENKGQKKLKGTACFFQDCEDFEISSKEKTVFTKTFFFNEPGDRDIMFFLNDGEKISRVILKAKVIDKPIIKIFNFSTTSVQGYGEDFEITFNMEKDSFATPKNVKLFVIIGKSEVNFDISSLNILQEFVIDANTKSFLHKTESIKVIVNYEDELGKEYTEEKSFDVSLEKLSFFDRVKMFFSRIFG